MNIARDLSNHDILDQERGIIVLLLLLQTLFLLVLVSLAAT